TGRDDRRRARRGACGEDGAPRQASGAGSSGHMKRGALSGEDVRTLRRAGRRGPARRRTLTWEALLRAIGYERADALVSCYEGARVPLRFDMLAEARGRAVIDDYRERGLRP